MTPTMRGLPWWYCGDDGCARPRSWWSATDCHCQIEMEGEADQPGHSVASFLRTFGVDPVKSGKLHDHVHFQKTLKSESREVLRCKGKLCISLICCADRPYRADDEEHVKKTMARLGHFVRLCAREVDFPAVLGDDTIAIIFVEADFVRAFNTTQRIIASARDAEIHYGENFAGIKFSAGLAGFPEHGIDPDVLLSSCQSFLAEAKLAAGDVVLPTPSRLLKTSQAMLAGNLTKPQDIANSFAFWGDIVSRNQEPLPLPPARRSSG